MTNARTAGRKKLDMLDGMERARLNRMIERGHEDRAFEEEHAAKGELQAPRGPANRMAGDFVQDRTLIKSAGAKLGFRKRSPLQRAYEKDQLGPRLSREAITRFEAGTTYAQIWRTSETSGRDSTDMDTVRGGNGGSDLPLAQARAIHLLAKIHSKMTGNDQTIISYVCGMEEKPSIAVTRIGRSYERNVMPRFCEALDALVEALDAGRRT